MQAFSANVILLRDSFLIAMSVNISQSATKLTTNVSFLKLIMLFASLAKGSMCTLRSPISVMTGIISVMSIT